MNIFNNLGDWPKPGSVVSVPTHIFFRHKGIVSDRWWGGKPMVISNSDRNGGPKEEPWDTFTSGRPWKDEGFPGQLMWWEVLQRARFPIRNQYNVLEWNCEDFVSYCHGLPSTSPQRAIAVMITFAVGLAFMASKS